jgi:uncharacterized protein
MNPVEKQRASSYNHLINVGAESILFNAFTGNMVSIPSRMNDIMDFAVDQRQQLSRLGFIVHKAPQDEAASVLDVLFTPSPCMYIVFTVATKCDLRCTYCFENRQKRTVMSLETLDLSLHWMEDQFAKGRFSELSVIVFGGEPLLFPDRVIRLLNGLSNIREKYSIRKCPILLTTNALSGTNNVLRHLRQLGMTQIQVTFDGDASITNARRKSHRISDIYHETLARLPMLAELSELTIKLNFSPTTISSIPRFMDDLFRIPALKENYFRIKPEPIVRYHSVETEAINPNEEYGSNDPRLAQSFDMICQLAEDRNFDIDRSAIFNTPCMAFRESSYLLEPDGSLRSCISAFGMDSFSTGHVKTGYIHDSQSMIRGMRIKDLKTCVEKNCAFLPMCGGGCPYEKELTTGKVNGLLCRHSYFKSALPVFVGSIWRTQRHRLFILP